MKKQSPLRTLAFIAFVLVAFAAMWANDDRRIGPTKPAHAASIPTPLTPETCVTIELDNKKYAHILRHAWAAQEGKERWTIPPTRDGKPEAKHLHIARGEAKAHRRASLKGVPTLRGFDRDEYPPAMSAEGGKGADVRYVRSKENRSAGAVMGGQLSGYPDGQCFQYEPKPR